MAEIEVKNLKERELFLYKQFNQDSISDLTKQILEINKEDDYLERQLNNLDLIKDGKIKRKPIKIYIDSYGGAVYQCLGLISVIQKSKTPIHTICTGAAMSCGFLLLISGHKRFAYEHATLMLHQISSFTIGEIETMKADVKEAERIQSILDCIILDNTRIDKKQYKEYYEKKKDWFFPSKQALELGIIDEVI